MLAETSFKDKDEIYRKCNIQVLELPNETYNMIVVNLDGYDEISCGLNHSMFLDNKELFFKHIDTVFGLTPIDNFQFIIITKDIKYKRSVKLDLWYGYFIQMLDGEFEKEYKRFLEN
jgi:hypothetical protein